jgi:hypothetical protein
VKTDTGIIAKTQPIGAKSAVNALTVFLHKTAQITS